MSWYLWIGSSTDNQRSQPPRSCRNMCLWCHFTLIYTKLVLEYLGKLLSPLYLLFLCRELADCGSAAFSRSLIVGCCSNARPGSSASPRHPAHFCKVWAMRWWGSSAWGLKIWDFNFEYPALSFRRPLFFPLIETNRLALVRENAIVFFNEKTKQNKNLC